MNNLEKVISHPVGILAIVLIVGCVFLFIWNLRRKELTSYEFVVKRDARLPDLSQLKKQLQEYFRKTYVLSRNSNLYNASIYGISSHSQIIRWFQLSNNNREYLKFKVDDDGISELKESIYIIVKHLINKKLEKFMNEVFDWEHKARSQQICVRLYRSQYEHLDRNEKKLLEAEETHNTNNVRGFSKSLQNLYNYLGIMERGEDL